MPITTEQIRQLLREAGEAGDLTQVALCERALAGGTAAWDECAAVIGDARAQLQAPRPIQRQAF